MPKAPKHVAQSASRPTIPTVEQTMAPRGPADESNPWAAFADPATDGWPAEANGSAPPTAAQLADDGAEAALDPAAEAVTPIQASEAAGEAPVTQETPAEPAPAATKKAPPAKRARPTPVTAAHQGEMAEASTGLQLAALDDTEDKINLVIYGAEGTGKTTDVCTAANHGPVLVINAEGGLKVKPLRARGINTSNIAVFPPPGQPHLLTVDNLERLFWQVQADLQRDPDAWYAVIWDSVTEIGAKLLRNIVEREVTKNSALPEGSAKRQTHRESADFTDRSDYGVLSNQMLPLLRKYRDLPCHFLATALERRDVDEDTGRVMYGPSTTPAVQTSLLGYVDLAIRVQNTAGDNDEQPSFVGRTRPARTTRAKDRFGLTPPVMPDPTYERIRAYLAGELVWTPEPETEPVTAPAETTTPAKRAPRKATPTKEN